MSNMIQYKDYVGSVEFSQEDGLFFGKVLGIRSLISYEGTNAHELICDFESAIDDYIKLCEENHVKPEKAYKGSFNLRISPDLHKALAIQASDEHMSLNSFVEKKLEQAMQAYQ